MLICGERPWARPAGVLIGVHDGSTATAAMMLLLRLLDRHPTAHIGVCGAVHDRALFVCANPARSAFRVDGKT